MKSFWNRVKSFAAGKGGALVMIGAFMMVMAEIAPNMCVYPAWHFEPELPGHLREQLDV